MAHRSKAPTRRERDSDTMEAIKPLVVLGLLGTILYGAYSVIQQGPGNAAGSWQLPGTSAPVAQGGPATEAPPFNAPAVEIPAPVGVQPVATASIAGIPAAPAAAFPSPPVTASPQPALPPASVPEDQPPTFLTAQSAAPPVAETPGPISPPATSTPLATPAQTVGLAARQAQLAADPAAAAPASAAFASAWTEAHDKLAAGRYAEALAVLSVWYDDPSLGLEESQQLESLLSQLAGSVIYSTQDLLLPPYIVAPGDTLQSIAAPLAVPWQLLAKINGVDDPSRLIPGEPLKVLRGPFDAIVSVSRRRLSLEVGGNYAGSFQVVVGRQVQDRIGSSLAVVDVRRGDAPASSAPPGQAAQVAFVSGGNSKSIILGDGLMIEAVEDPGLVADAAPSSSLLVASRDLDEIIDILGPGSQVLVRK
jgi:hypothetical protein